MVLLELLILNSQFDDGLKKLKSLCNNKNSVASINSFSKPFHDLLHSSQKFSLLLNLGKTEGKTALLKKNAYLKIFRPNPKTCTVKARVAQGPAVHSSVIIQEQPLYCYYCTTSSSNSLFKALQSSSHRMSHNTSEHLRKSQIDQDCPACSMQ